MDRKCTAAGPCIGVVRATAPEESNSYLRVWPQTGHNAANGPLPIADGVTPVAEQISEPMDLTLTDADKAWIVDLIRSPSRQHEILERRQALASAAQHRAAQEAAAMSRRAERIAAMKRLPDETIWQFERRKATAAEILDRAALAHPNGTSDTDGGEAVSDG